MTPKQKAELCERLAGTCNTLDHAAEAIGVSLDDAAEAVGELGIELCTTCGWWCEDDELEIVDGEYTCQDCREGEE